MLDQELKEARTVSILSMLCNGKGQAQYLPHLNRLFEPPIDPMLRASDLRSNALPSNALPSNVEQLIEQLLRGSDDSRVASIHGRGEYQVN